MLYKSCWPIRQFLAPQATWRRPSDRPVLYLTFDDGPIPEETPWVLETLQAHGAQATFFCVGDNVHKHPQVYAQLQASGHAIGNHTFHHVKGWGMSTETYLQEVALCARALGEATVGQQGKPLFRPPHGQITRAQLRALQPHYEVVLWDVLAMDYDASLSAERSLRKCIAHTRPGTILVLHDSLKASGSMRYILPRYLSHFLAEGYVFERL